MKYYLVLKNGIEIEITKIQADSIVLQKKQGIKEALINGQLTNITDTNISGIFDEHALFERDQRKKGGWKCSYNAWHDRTSICDCGRYTSIDTEQKLLDSAKPHFEWKTALKEVLKGYMQVKGITKLEDLDEFGLNLAKCKSFNELKKKVYEVAH